MTRPPRLYFFAYDHNRASGGQKDTYEQVEILNAAGMDAVIVHNDPAFRLTWFENEVPVVGKEQFLRAMDAEADIVVLPEDIGPAIAQFPGAKVLFDKNVYSGLSGFGPSAPHTYPALRSDVIAVMAVSEHNARHLRFAYPETPVLRVLYSVKQHLFQARAWKEKRPRIATIGKSLPQLFTAYHTLMARSAAGWNRAGGVEWVAARGRSEAEMAELLMSSAAAVFTSVEEGLPRFVVEALLCGCVVIAFSAGPLPEVLPAGYEIEYGDTVAAVRLLEEVVNDFPANEGRFRERLDKGVSIGRQFTRARQEESVIGAWKEVLRLHAKRRARGRGGEAEVATGAGRSPQAMPDRGRR